MFFQLLINGIIAGAIYALVALGFTVIYRTVKFFHLAHGAVYICAAYLAYFLARGLGLNFVLSFFLAVVLSALIGICIDRLIYFPLRVSKSPNLVFLIASFGVFIFIQNLIQLIFSAQVLSLRNSPVEEGWSIFSAVITPVQVLILVLSLILMIILWFLSAKTRIGRAMQAVADDPVAASVVGINPEKTILASFAVGSGLAGIAGILISLETNIEPAMGFSAIFKGIIASIIGGVGSIPGAMLGGFFLGIAENLGIWKIQAGWKDSIAFIVLIIFLLFRPGGILAAKTRKEDI